MVSKRQSRLEGHRRKFMAVIDNTPESSRAVRYAGMRAKNSGGGVVLLFVIADADFNQWIGVTEIMRAEAR
jgi:nucleotide-binding universal stress UspA family protein